jgi:hypothetical protein
MVPRQDSNLRFRLQQGLGAALRDASISVGSDDHLPRGKFRQFSPLRKRQAFSAP